MYYDSIIIILFISHTFNPPPLPRDESVVSRDQPISPRYTPCILISRIGSALPHRVYSHQHTQSTTFVYSRSHAFHGRNHTLRRKTQLIGNRTLDFYPNREIRTILIHTTGARLLPTDITYSNCLTPFLLKCMRAKVC